jgi:glycosyltransferase involved in cell wall biosynthesis
MSRILHILASARAEGTPRLVVDWLAEKSHVQSVLLLSADHPEMVAELMEASQGFFQGHLKLEQGGRRRRRSVVDSVVNGCVTFMPDVVVCWPTWAARATGTALKRCGRGVIKLIVHCGNPALCTVVEYLASDIRFFPAYRANAVFACCSDYVRDSFRRRTLFAKRRFQTVQNCISLARIQARANRARLERKQGDRIRFIMVGTMEGHKDQATLVKAASLLRVERSDFEVWLAGGGTNLEVVRALIAHKGVGDCVIPLGSRDDVPELLGQSDVFVFSTTRAEGFGTVLIEALAAGLPVIASDVPACREALQGGRYGALVPAQDAPALAATMRPLLDRRTHPSQVDSAAYIQRFSAQAMIDNYLSLCP